MQKRKCLYILPTSDHPKTISMGSQIVRFRSPSVSLLILETHVIIPWSYICVESTLIVQITLESTAPSPLPLRWLQSTVASKFPLPPSLPPPSPSPSPHVRDNRRNSRDATAVLIFWDHREYVYFRTYLVFIFVLRKCLRIVLKYQRLILMEQRRPKKPTDEWICQRIFKWISSSPVSALLGIQNGPWPRVVKYFSFFVTHQLLRTSLFTCWSPFFFSAHSQRKVGTSTRLPYLLPLKAA